ncbi:MULTISPECIES: hypothetical protein [unclassified Kribbella]|uniref:hypothetical protein n=1 Tax=unclassified Kribbella TaxID=2644121 RepID=UPI00301780E1
MSTLTWLTVPQRITGNDAHVSVLVVPRLGGGRLQDFGLRDWPARLTEMSFEVRIRSGGVQSIANGRPTLASVPDSEVWHAFFDGAAGTIEDGTVRPAPRTPTVRDSYTDAVRTHDTHRVLARSIARSGVTGEVENELAPWSHRRPRMEPDIQQTAVAPNVDFHRAVALLRDHPRVMRALGLVFDLVVDADLLDIGDPADRAIAIASDDSPVPVISPWTRYTLRRTPGGGHPAHFRAADHPAGLHRAGMLDIHTARSVGDTSRPPDPGWLISTMDIEGAVNDLREAAQAINRGDPLLLPRARSAGIALVRRGRQADYDALARRAQERPTDTADVELTAEDLILGYRVDIRRGGGAWRSLCERDASYTVRTTDGRSLAIGNPGTEEGHVKPHSTVKRDDGTLETDEVVLRWDGWSLVLPSPGAERGARRTATTMPYDFEWSFDVPRDPTGTPLPTLPALRFAEPYQMRVRVADITGGGPLLDEPDREDAAGPSIVYTRHEPVEPPILDSTDPLQLGAGIDTLVVSTDADDEHEPVTKRNLIPPHGSFRLAEQHRMFDHPAARDLARRAFDRSLRNAPPAVPDAAAQGIKAFVRAEPGGLDRSWSGLAQWPDWPLSESKTIELIGLADPDAETALDLDDNGLTVRLPRAEQITVELSSTIRGDFLDHFAVGCWILEDGATHGWSEAAYGGRHPMLSPVRRLTFVHVVKRPLVAPVWELPDSAVTRSPGASFVDLAPTFKPTGLDTDSTARLEVGASWTDHSDTGPAEQAVEHLHAVTIARGAPAVPAFRHEFGDTKHRVIKYRLTAISRFRHFFPDSEPDEAFQQSAVQPHTVNVLSSVRPSPPRVLATVPAFAFETSREPDRMTRRRRVALRVELARPWFSTGEGERLAVVVAPASADDTVPATRMGRDPIMASSPVPHLVPASRFTGNSLRPTDIELPEYDGQLTVIPYDVQDAGDHWYADVWLDVPSAYAPFVQLVVARYQPDSLDGLETSNLVTCETVRALPNRLLAVEHSSQTLRITVTGQGPQTANRLEAVIDELRAEFDPDTVELLALPGAQPSPVTAWRPRPDTSSTGTIGTPLPPITIPHSTGHLRLRVREIDDIPSDGFAIGPPELIEQTPYFDIVALPQSWRTA